MALDVYRSLKATNWRDGFGTAGWGKGDPVNTRIIIAAPRTPIGTPHILYSDAAVQVLPEASNPAYGQVQTGTILQCEADTLKQDILLI